MGLTRSLAVRLLVTLGLLTAPAMGGDEKAIVESGKKFTGYVRVQTKKGLVSGSAFCIDPSGLFVSNRHVIAPAEIGDKITMTLAPGTPAERVANVTVLRADAINDLAILRIDKPGLLETVPLAPPAVARAVRREATVYAFGFPFGQGLALAGGKSPEISVSPGKIIDLIGENGVLEQIVFNGSINPGNSGGPVVDAEGRLIGVTRAIIPAENTNFAVPVQKVRELLAAANIVLTPSVITSSRPVVLADETEPAGRTAVPDDAAYKAAEKKIRELLSAEYAAKSLKDRAALAEKLMAQAAATNDDAIGRYVLLKEAIEQAVFLNDLETAFVAAGEIGKRYDVRTIDLKADVLGRIGPQLTQPQDAALVTAHGLVLAEAATRRQSFGTARRMVAVARAASTVSRNPGVINGVRDRLARIDVLAAEFDQVKPSIDKLKTSPADPDLNLAVGRYLCFGRGDFVEGLPLLAKGKDPFLKAAAVADIAKPTAGIARKDLGDLWWDQVPRETRSAAAADRCRQRAAYWYRLADSQLTGLTQQALRQRMATLSAATANPIVMTTESIGMPAGAALADEPLKPVPGNVKLVKSELLGGKGGKDFEETGPKGALMVGFAFTLDGSNRISRIQPMYLSGGKQVPGKIYGKDDGKTYFIIGKEGYAVGGFLIRASDRVDQLSVIFNRRVGDHLDPKDFYIMKPMGTEKGELLEFSSKGRAIVGIAGRAGAGIDAFGVIIADPK